MKNSKIYLMSALSGLLYVLAFPPIPFNFLAFIFISPLLFALEQKPTHWFRLTYLTFLIQHIGTLWWVGSWQEDSDPFLMIASIVLCVFHPFFVCDCSFLIRSSWSLLTSCLYPQIGHDRFFPKETGISGMKQKLKNLRSFLASIELL